MSNSYIDTPLREACSELNLCAISSLFAEARRVEANLHAVATQSRNGFWNLMPPAALRSVYDYRKGFAAYQPEEGYESEIEGWPFEITGFPHTLAQLPGKKERLPVFYEFLSPKGITTLQDEAHARAFVVDGDEIRDIAKFRRLQDIPDSIYFDTEVALYTLQPSSQFTFYVMPAKPLALPEGVIPFPRSVV